VAITICPLYYSIRSSRSELIAFDLSTCANMGRKGNFDVKDKKGPGRKARKQGEPNMNLFMAKTIQKSSTNALNQSGSVLKR